MSRELGRYLRKLRVEKDLSLRDLAEKAELSFGFLSAIENGRYEPSRDSIIKISQALDCDPDPMLILRGFLPEGQKSESKRDESHTELSDNSSTLNVHPGIGFNSQRSQKVIDFALEQMHREDAIRIDPDILRIPVLGTIRAGYDLYAEQQMIGMEPVAKQSVSDGAEYFFLVVKGDSMSGDNIRDGMRVLVRRQDWVEEGKIAVVLVNGDEATLKRVYVQDNGMVSLVASNSDYPPRFLPMEDAKIQGQVKQVVWDV